MTTVEFISALFCRVDAALHDVPTHPQATLYPSEVVTVALLFALKGDGERAVSRWLERDYRPLFPQLPERPRLFRLFRLFRLCAAHQGWTARFLAPPTVLGVAESDGIALLHPYRAKRHPLPDRLGRETAPLARPPRAQGALQPPLDRRRRAGRRAQPGGPGLRLGGGQRQRA